MIKKKIYERSRINLEKLLIIIDMIISNLNLDANRGKLL